MSSMRPPWPSDFAKGSGFIGGGTLAVFSATCPQSPTICAPLWTAPVEYGQAPMTETPVVANNEVYVSMPLAGRLPH